MPSACRERAAWPQKHQHNSPHPEPPFLSCAVENNACPHGCPELRLSVRFSLLWLPSFSQVTLFSALSYRTKLQAFSSAPQPYSCNPEALPCLSPIHTCAATCKPQGQRGKQGPARLLPTSPGHSQLASGGPLLSGRCPLFLSRPSLYPSLFCFSQPWPLWYAYFSGCFPCTQTWSQT